MPGTIKQLIQNYLNKNVVQVSANMETVEIKESITSIL
jgi:ATP-dependent RNA helicase DeaD